MDKKYKLTNEHIMVNGIKLYRIKALRDFPGVGEGIVGGFVESEDNLSHMGSSWVYDNAMVLGNAHVSDDAIICGKALVCDASGVGGHAAICDKAKICNNAKIFGRAIIIRNSVVSDYARISGSFWLSGSSRIMGDSFLNFHQDTYQSHEINVNTGVWIKLMREEDNIYLISTTLKKLKINTI